ncbi:FtsB/FtsL family cell division protein [Olsenella phocaeensis]|uniref:hypothetical protein n=1 Tax=Olsenella phocaeensis TaxID=1852385 RepID=UPI00093150B2|nr:hypothetical protein [Olsenella phocaeensis]
MRYAGSEAYSLDANEGRRRLDERGHAPFEVVEGGGLDARARRGVSSQFVAAFRVTLCLIAAVFVLGGSRVLISTATVRVLEANSGISQSIEEAKVANENLQIVRSSLCRSSRIDRIATQNYGMVFATSTDTIQVDDQNQNQGQDASQQEGEPSADDAQHSDEAGSAAAES